jgi:hypothetical protein
MISSYENKKKDCEIPVPIILQKTQRLRPKSGLSINMAAKNSQVANFFTQTDREKERNNQEY